MSVGTRNQNRKQKEPVLERDNLKNLGAVTLIMKGLISVSKTRNVYILYVGSEKQNLNL